VRAVAGTGVRVIAVEPGFFATGIYGGRHRAVIEPSSHYAAALAGADIAVATGIGAGADPSVVADAIVAAAHDPRTPVRVLVGDDTLGQVRTDGDRRKAEPNVRSQRPTGRYGTSREWLPLPPDSGTRRAPDASTLRFDEGTAGGCSVPRACGA
jgi:hypothetical protein